MQAVFDKLIKIVFPEKAPCPVCGLPGKRPGICHNCFEQLCYFKKSAFCPKCGRFPLAKAPDIPDGDCPAAMGAAGVIYASGFTAAPRLCAECREEPPLFDLARAVGPYEGKLKDCIYQFKYFGHRSLASPLATLMTELFLAEKRWRRVDGLAPVPVGPEKLLARRFNQAELLACKMAKILRLPVFNLLERKFDTATQSKLTRQERRRNLRHAFALKNRAEAVGKRLVLVDDIMTTGSTADECTAILKSAGAAEVFLLTLATGRR
jgi:ComF family protein